VLCFKFARNSQFWHQFGINFAVINDFIIHGIVENLAFLSVKHIAFGIFSQKKGWQPEALV